MTFPQKLWRKVNPLPVLRRFMSEYACMPTGSSSTLLPVGAQALPSSAFCRGSHMPPKKYPAHSPNAPNASDAQELIERTGAAINQAWLPLGRSRSMAVAFLLNFEDKKCLSSSITYKLYADVCTEACKAVPVAPSETGKQISWVANRLKTV